MSAKEVLGGYILRPYIRRLLGKDWFESWTTIGLIVYFAADGAVDAVCGDTLMLSAVFCAKATAFLKGFGTVLTVLGIRRHKQG